MLHVACTHVICGMHSCYVWHALKANMRVQVQVYRVFVTFLFVRYSAVLILDRPIFTVIRYDFISSVFLP